MTHFFSSAVSVSSKTNATLQDIKDAGNDSENLKLLNLSVLVTDALNEKISHIKDAIKNSDIPLCGKSKLLHFVENFHTGGVSLLREIYPDKELIDKLCNSLFSSEEINLYWKPNSHTCICESRYQTDIYSRISGHGNLFFDSDSNTFKPERSLSNTTLNDTFRIPLSFTEMEDILNSKYTGPEERRFRLSEIVKDNKFYSSRRPAIPYSEILNVDIGQDVTMSCLFDQEKIDQV